MDSVFQDLRYTARTLLRSPGFALVAVLTLGLGIGANTAIFSVVEGVLLRTLPYPEPDEIVRVFQVGEDGGRMSFSHPNFADVRERSRTFAALAEYAYGTAPLTVGGEAARVGYAAVSGEFFDVVGVRPAIGRGFLPEETDGRGAAVALVSHAFWQGALGGVRDLSSLALGTRSGPVAVVGVLPASFRFPEAGEVDVIVPYAVGANPSRTAHNWQVIGRLRDGATVEQARQDLGAIARRLEEEHGEDTWMAGAAVVPLHEYLVGDVKPALLVLLGAAGFLLLIACANVVNLLLSRLAARQRELSVRLALGAGIRRVAQQFLAEALLLSLAGGAAGVLLAAWGVDVLLALEPGRLPRLDEVGVNAAVLGFALAISVATAVAMGLLTAWRSMRTDVRGSLAASQRTVSGGLSSHRVRGALVVVEVALTIVLLVGAGLLARSFGRLLDEDPGYRTRGAVVLELSMPSGGDAAEQARHSRYVADVIERLRAIPGVEDVGGMDAFPLSGGGADGTFLVVDRPDDVVSFDDWRRLSRDPNRTGSARYRIATAGYFRAMGIPLVRGRLFDGRDGPDAPHAAVISESLARTHWPDEDPIGKLIQYGNMDGDLRVFTIVGIVGDVRDASLEAEPAPTFYGNALQRAASLPGPFSVVVSGPGDPAATIATAREAVRALDPSIPLRFRTLDDIFSAALAERRFSVMLLGLFAFTALFVASAGLYGVISYLVAQRTREVGIRIAVGARPVDVLRHVVVQGAVLAGIGVACGIVVALGLTRFLAGMLYGVGTTDPITFVGIALLLFIIALVASYVPARRAMRVDPMVALRVE